jgi:hypothetical protein
MTKLTETKNLGKCSEKVYSGYRWDFTGHTCQNKAIIIEDGKPYCKRHSKAGKDSHNDKLNAKVEASINESRIKYARQNAIAQITDGFTTDKLIQYKDTIREFIGRL